MKYLSVSNIQMSAQQRPSGPFEYHIENVTDKNEVAKLFEHNYLDLAIRTGDANATLSWDKMIARRRGRYHRMSLESAKAIVAARAKTARDLLLSRCNHPSSKDISACDDIRLVASETCDKPSEWMTREQWSKKNTVACAGRKPKLPGDDLFPSGQKTFLLGMIDDIVGQRCVSPHYIVMPFSSEHAFRTDVSWNVPANIAMLVCAMYNPNTRFGLRFLLPENWDARVARDTEKAGMTPVGRVFIRFDKLQSDEPRTTGKDLRNGEEPRLEFDVWKYISGNEAHNSHMDPFYSPYALFRKDRRVDWGDYSARKRITYYEIRQVLAHLQTKKVHLYEISKDDAKDEFKHYVTSMHSQNDLNDRLRKEGKQPLSEVKLEWTDDDKKPGGLKIVDAKKEGKWRVLSDDMVPEMTPTVIDRLAALYTPPRASKLRGGSTNATSVVKPTKSRLKVANVVKPHSVKAMKAAKPRGSREPVNPRGSKEPIDRYPGIQPYHYSRTGIYMNGATQGTAIRSS